MTSSVRLAARLGRAVTTGERLLVVYVTLGDPVTCDPLALLLRAVEAGADVLELGLPTPGARPRGDEIRASFDRARAAGPVDVWAACAALRALAPEVPLLPLVYPETIEDLGGEALVEGAAAAGVDGLVLVEPRVDLMRRAAAAGLSAVPVLRLSTPAAEVAALEAEAPDLTYRVLAEGTGAVLDLDAARRVVAAARATSRRPFMVGFGLRDAAEIRALVAEAAGFVVGSELIRRVARAEPDARADVIASSVAGWRAAATSAPEDVDGGSGPGRR